MAPPTDDRDPVSKQLKTWDEQHKESEKCPIRYNSGLATSQHDVSLTVGSHGPMVLFDHGFFEKFGHFDRERIPERVVHARGAGAFGHFTVTDDITEFTSATVFATIGKRTPIAIRFSRVATHLGSADSVRDVRGFALKFYTEDGNWDVVGNNTPIFFIREPKLFPMFIHSQKNNPATNCGPDWEMRWDFWSQKPQTIHQVMFLFTDRGIPNGYRHMDGFGSHTFVMVNSKRNLTYVKFHFKTNQGIENITPKDAERLAGRDPDYYIRDLYNAIASGRYPSWTMYIQTMSAQEAFALLPNFDPFDITKVWPHHKFPLKKVGKLVLNRNPNNEFAEIEQLAFKPNNFIPGVGPSPDRLLQGRLFTYQDTQRYRLGVNYEYLPVNRPIVKICNYNRDGAHTFDNMGGAPNYHPNSFGGPEVERGQLARVWPHQYEQAQTNIIGTKIGFYDLSDQDNFSQPRWFYQKVLDEGARQRMIDNLAETLRQISSKVRNKALENFRHVDEELERRLRAAIRKSDVKDMD